MFAEWRAAVPAGFVFAVKASRGATASSDPARCGESVERFMESGLHALGDALGPILWQFQPTRRFDPGFFERFLALLPDELAGRPLRHAVEFRHPSGHDPAFATLLAARGVALALVARPDQTAFFMPARGFAYVRIEETADEEEQGLPAPGSRSGPGACARWPPAAFPPTSPPGCSDRPRRPRRGTCSPTSSRGRSTAIPRRRGR